MEEKTKGMLLFERFCSERSIPCDYIPTRETKTPDYEITIGDATRVVAEVKDSITTEKDQELFEAMFEEAVLIDDRSRIEHHIKTAMKQLKAGAEDKHPAVLVLYDDRMLSFDDSDVMHVMYGADELVMGVKQFEEPRVVDHRYGRDKRCTPDQNTTLSAVCHLKRWNDDSLYLDVYHNIHAARQLDPDWFRHDGVSHYSIHIGTRRHQAWHQV